MMNRRQREDVLVRRTVTVETIPSGQPFELQEGQLAQITQALGSSFTLVVEGQLVRLRGDDADAIGKGPPESIVVPENVSTADIEPLIWETLKSCYDPEIPVNIVDLGLIYRCEVTPIDAHGDVQVVIDMTLTAPGCGMGTLIADEAQAKLLTIPGVAEAEVKLVWDPPWSREMMSEAARLEMGLY